MPENITDVVTSFLEGKKVLYVVSQRDKRKHTREIREEVLRRNNWVLQNTPHEFSIENGGSLRIVCIDDEDWSATPQDTLLYLALRPDSLGLPPSDTGGSDE